MPASLIAQLIVALGPVALDLIPKLAAVWNKGSLTLDEVNALCVGYDKTQAQYMAEAQAALGQK